MTFWRQAWLIGWRDLRIEGRSGEVAGVVLPFAAVAVFVVPLAVDPLRSRLAELGLPVFWLVVLLFGMQVAMRQTGLETTTQRRHLALAGVDPLARFVGRSATVVVLLLAVVAVTLPLTILVYNPDHPPGWEAVPVLALFALGLAMLSTLAGDVTAGLRGRSTLAPMVVAPLAVPLLIGGSQSLESVAQGRSTLTWTLLLVITDLALAAAGVLTAGFLEEASL